MSKIDEPNYRKETRNGKRLVSHVLASQENVQDGRKFMVDFLTLMS